MGNTYEMKYHDPSDFVVHPTRIMGGEYSSRWLQELPSMVYLGAGEKQEFPSTQCLFGYGNPFEKITYHFGKRLQAVCSLVSKRKGGKDLK